MTHNYLPKGNGDSIPQLDFHMDIHSRPIHESVSRISDQIIKANQNDKIIA